MVSCESTLESLQDYLPDLYKIPYLACAAYSQIPIEHRMKFCPTTQANIIRDQMLSEADKCFFSNRKIKKFFSSNKLIAYLFKEQKVSVRFKKMNEYGLVYNIKTAQAKNYNNGNDIFGMDSHFEQLNVGYVLDQTGTQHYRTIISKPNGQNNVFWSAYIYPDMNKIRYKVIQNNFNFGT